MKLLKIDVVALGGEEYFFSSCAFDVKTGLWIEMPRMTTNRSRYPGAVATRRGESHRIYVFGGLNKTFHNGNEIMDTCEFIDVVGETEDVLGVAVVVLQCYFHSDDAAVGPFLLGLEVDGLFVQNGLAAVEMLNELGDAAFLDGNGRQFEHATRFGAVALHDEAPVERHGRDRGRSVSRGQERLAHAVFALCRQFTAWGLEQIGRAHV